MFNWSPSTSCATLQSIKSSSPSTSSSFGHGILKNLLNSPIFQSLSSLDKSKLWSQFYVDDEQGIQKVLDAVSNDQKVITNPRANHRRRTLILTRRSNQSFGFTLQTYLLRRKGDSLPSKITYIDYVQLDSPAAEAGIRAGDVIISINGRVVTGLCHTALVQLISSCHQMRMIVIYESVRERIDLVARAIRLRKILNDKLYQLNLIDIEEQKILNKGYLRTLSRQKPSKADFGHSLSTHSARSLSLSPVIASNSATISSSSSNRYQQSIIVNSDSVLDLCRGAQLNAGFSNEDPAVKRMAQPLARKSAKLVQQIRCFGGSEFVDLDLDSSISLSSLEIEEQTITDDEGRDDSDTSRNNSFAGNRVASDDRQHFDSVDLRHVIRLEDVDEGLYTRVCKF